MSASESAGPKRSAEERAEKVLRGPRLCRKSYRRGGPKHFFGTFLGTPFGAGTFRSTLFGTFPGRGFGTSLDGRHSRKSRIVAIHFRGFGRLENPNLLINKEVRPFFLRFAVSPLVFSLAITAFGRPEGYFSLAIRAFGAFGFIVPEYYYRLGNMDKRSLDSLI